MFLSIAFDAFRRRHVKWVNSLHIHFVYTVWRWTQKKNKTKRCAVIVVWWKCIEVTNGDELLRNRRFKPISVCFPINERVCSPNIIKLNYSRVGNLRIDSRYERLYWQIKLDNNCRWNFREFVINIVLTRKLWVGSVWMLLNDSMGIFRV